jgi:hypothetical protein
MDLARSDSPTSSLYLEPPNPRWDPFVQKRTVNVPAGLLDSYGGALRMLSVERELMPACSGSAATTRSLSADWQGVDRLQ